MHPAPGCPEINNLHFIPAVIEVASRCGSKAAKLTIQRFKAFNQFMSQHSSLRSVGTTAAKRNVLKRFERVALLKKRGQWKEGDRVSGLRKTKPEA